MKSSDLYPWPNSLASLVDELYHAWRIPDRFWVKRDIKGGFSTSRVYAVDISTEDGFSGEAILKLTPPGAVWATPDESTRHLQACAPAAFKKRIPALLQHHSSSNGTATLFKIAAGGLEYTSSWATASHEVKARILVLLSQELLDDWNANGSMDYCPRSPSALIRSWLAYRLDPGEGRLYRFVDEELSMQYDENSFIYPETEYTYPNPLFLVERDLPSESFIPVIGKTHGDLHTGNVLVQETTAKHSPYFVIDFAQYEEEKPLFVDHAYFELSALLAERYFTNEARWLDVIRALRPGGKPTSPDDLWVVQIINASRRSLQTWIDSTYEDRRASLVKQLYLARVAAGLNYANKQIDTALRIRSFLYAAVSLSELYRFVGHQWNTPGVVIGKDSAAQHVSSGQWRSVWDHCGQFMGGRAVFALILASSVKRAAPASLRALARLPWSLVLDFDQSGPEDGCYFVLRDELLERRGTHLAVPDDIGSSYTHGTRALTWLLVDGWTQRPASLCPDFSTWRRRILSRVDTIFNGLSTQSAHLPLYVLIFDAANIDAEKITRLLESCEDTFADRHNVVSMYAGDAAPVARTARSTSVQCSIDEFTYGIEYMLGRGTRIDAVQLPTRTSASHIALSPLPLPLLRLLEEDLEVIHDGLTDDSDMRADFLRGATITWRELDLDADVTRDLQPQLSRDVTVALERGRNHTIVVYHAPGAGGTTLARRIAWEQKGNFPTVLLRRFGDNTATRISQLYQHTGLPVLIVAEAAIISAPERDSLYNQLKGSAANAKAVILYVERHGALVNAPDKVSTWPGEPLRHNLYERMGTHEALRFLPRYIAHAPSSRHAALHELAKSDALRNYRSPFFFGLYAFEEQFLRVPEFVGACLSGIPSNPIRVIRFMALVRRFCQLCLDENVVRELLGLDPGRPNSPEQMFGHQAARLITWDQPQGGISIIHPTIAEEVLRQLSRAGDWRAALVEISCDFIREVFRLRGTGDRKSEAVLHQMFIDRKYYDPQGQKREFFADLILEVSDDPHGQHKVLATLTECFPDDPHYWNHRGRHSNYVLKEEYQKSAEYFRMAITIDPSNEIHPHALGMVYRFEWRRRLDNLQRDTRRTPSSAIAAEFWKDNGTLFEQAMACFAKARELQAGSDYTFVTPVQLVLETIDRFKDITGLAPHKLLCEASDLSYWLREQASNANDLLVQLRGLRSEGAQSDRANICEQRLLGVYGDIDSMVQGLQRLLSRPGTDHVGIRRLIVGAYYQDRRQDWSTLGSTKLRTIYTMMQRNIQDGSTSWSDMRYWFQAYRRLPEFDSSEAIHRLSTWVNQRETTDGYYYLYILHFLRWYGGSLVDVRVVERALQLCAQLAQKTPVIRQRSFEWLGIEPRGCPLVHLGELGAWTTSGEGEPFYQNTSKLRRIRGIVSNIDGPQKGYIEIIPDAHSVAGNSRSSGSMKAFFAPRLEFRKGSDENTSVTMFLGFSYEDLHAWSVARA